MSIKNNTLPSRTTISGFAFADSILSAGISQTDSFAHESRKNGGRNLKKII